MEKGLHNFETLPEIQNFFPALPQDAQNRLCDSLIDNGCTIPIFVWKRKNRKNETNDANGENEATEFTRIIVDGHYRYKICHELGIPFDYKELEFADLDAVKIWRLDMHTSTKQLSDFQKCELALPLEKAISEMVERRRREAISRARQTGLQISQSGFADEDETGLQVSQSVRTANYMAQRLGVTRSKWDMAKFLIKNADEDLKAKLRSGVAKITPEYRRLVALIKPKEEAVIVEEADTAKVPETSIKSEEKYGGAVNAATKSVNEPVGKVDDCEDWLPRACSTDGEDIQEPEIEHIAGFKPVTHQEPFEYFPHEPERNPGPFYYVKDYTRSALKNMLKEITDAVYQLSDEDAEKGYEILSMLDEAYNEARKIIEGEIEFHSHHE